MTTSRPGIRAASNGRRGFRLAAAAVVLVGITACSNRSDTADTAAPTAPPTTVASGSTEAPTTTAAGADTSAPGVTDPPSTDPPGITFGDMASPCGPGDATIAEGQNGGDTLKLATASDKQAVVAPGLDQEMYDTALAFADWCNEQGGIKGLPIEIVDADGKLFEVPAAMERVCADAFAMVGGGWAFDDQQFPRFHECGMIDIAGYAATTAKAMSNGMVQAIPNSTEAKPGIWWKWVKENHPDAIDKVGIVYADITSASLASQADEEIMAQLGGFTVVENLPSNPSGEANWAPFSQRLKDSGVKVMSFVGAPETLSQLLRSMAEIDFTPEVLMLGTNFYAEVLINQAGAAAEGAIAHTALVPFEEADRSKAVADYLDMMDTYNPDGKIASLGLQSMSAFLLFANAANACIESNDGVLERQCVLTEAGKVHEWTAGGLHGPTDPGARMSSPCAALVKVVDGKWTRLWPELDSAEDDGNGFACDDGLVTLTGDYGDVNAGVDPDR